MWEDKYEIDTDMIPSIITQDFAQKVFLIGKSLHFIRHSCGDSLWVEDYSKAASKELRYGDTATLEAWIDEAYLKGVHIVAACNNIDFQKAEWPGYFPTVFTVNFCQTIRPDQFFYRPGFMVEFAARGEDVEVPWSNGGYKKVTGTSYATPHVVGLLARLISSFPGLSPLEAKALMLRLAERSASTSASNAAPDPLALRHG